MFVWSTVSVMCALYIQAKRIILGVFNTNISYSNVHSFADGHSDQ